MLTLTDINSDIGNTYLDAIQYINTEHHQIETINIVEKDSTNVNLLRILYPEVLNYRCIIDTLSQSTEIISINFIDYQYDQNEIDYLIDNVQRLNPSYITFVLKKCSNFDWSKDIVIKTFLKRYECKFKMEFQSKQDFVTTVCYNYNVETINWKDSMLFNGLYYKRLANNVSSVKYLTISALKRIIYVDKVIKYQGQDL